MTDNTDHDTAGPVTAEVAAPDSNSTAFVDGGADSAPPAVTPDKTAYDDPLWCTVDTVWEMDPAKVQPEHLRDVFARRHESGPSLLRDAIALGRLRHYLVTNKLPTKWTQEATGYKERRLQDFRTLTEALDGLIPGVTIGGDDVGADRRVAPAHWIIVGVDGAIAEIRELRAVVKKAANEAAEKVALAALDALPKAEQDTIRRNQAISEVGKNAWTEDAVEVAGVLSEHPDIADEVVDALVELVVQGVKTLAEDARYKALQRAHRALGVKVKEAVPSKAEPEPDHIKDLVVGESK